MQINTLAAVPPSRDVIANRKKFLQWMKRQNPKAYAAIMRRAGLHVMNAGTDPVAEPSIWDKIVSGAQQILPTIVQARAQKQIFDAQLKRAKQGLPPLKTAEIAPTIRVQAEVGRETREAVTGGILQTLKHWAVPVLVGGGALYVLFKNR